MEAMGAGGAWAKGLPATGRWAGRGSRVHVEDGARVQWAFLGCPGMGKGTYAGRLSRLLGAPHISTGDVVRDELASQGPLSKQFQNNNEAAALEDTVAVALRRSVEFDEGRAWSREGWIVLFLELTMCVEPPNGAAVFGNCHVTDRGGKRRIIMVGPQMLGSALMLNQRLKTRCFDPAIVLFSVADETFRCIRSPLFHALYSRRSFPSNFSLPDQPQKHPISPPTTLPEHLPPSACAPHFARTPICRAGFPFENLLGKMWSKTPDGMVDSTILGIDSFQRRSENPKGSWLGGKGH